ncbi:MAG: serine hydrolase domain-containing protein [Bacteroidales bacterium]|nr:serine hydrolase domain-containing protein [Bacteroidales bacterium]
MKRITALSLIIVATLISCNLTQSQNELAHRPETQALIDSLVVANDIPGLNFSILLPDGTQENYSSGYSDVESEIMLDPADVLFSGSIGKTYAVAILMQLVDEGMVSLSDSIADYFQEVDWLSRIPNIYEITIEMLLKHTTGITRWVMKPEVWKVLHDSPDKVWNYEDRFAFVFDDEPAHPAGEGWGYSDTNYLLIGMLIEKLTGKEYYDLLDNRVLKPTGLKSTYPSDHRDIYNLAQGYSRLPDDFMIPEKVVLDGNYVFNPQMEWTGGGVASTTSDLAKWAEIYYTGNLFSDSLLLKIVCPTDEAIRLGKKTLYSMGSFIFETDNGIAYGHSGFVPGFNALFAYYPENQIAVALQFNSDYAGAKSRLNSYLDQIVSLYMFE